MNPNAEQFLTASQAALADLVELNQAALAGVEKLVELNLNTARDGLSAGAEMMQALLAAKTPQELMVVQSAQVESLLAKASAYGRAVFAISNEAGSTLGAQAESQLAKAQAAVVDSVETAMKSAPAGSEPAVAAFRNAFKTSQQALATAQASARQAVETAQKNLTASTELALNAAKPASKKK